jgi:antitoxin ParD1/3/4
MSDYHFPADLQPYVDEMLASGRYEHVSEIILEGVYLHRDREWLRRHKHNELKKEIQLGLDELDRGEVVDGPEYFDKVLNRTRTKREAS